MRFLALALWILRGETAILRGDTVSIQPTDIPVGTPARTIHDVEIDLAAARYAQKRGPARRYPDDITRFDAAVNTYLDEWTWHKAGLVALDFPVQDEPNVHTFTGGPLDADCG